ncbi:glycopeptide antibiotics resistance protein [Brevibacterium marinum]|uniref:Glycopeptide antibiotics resistance protein n=1 Tax=Brevibacterium marinum TaxID=418643 RepID=A0A846RWS1_9MICO|nr:glycopeptide antibiotics resistance protein [Brevibacterium marinum]
MSSFAVPAILAVIVGCAIAVFAFVPFVAISFRRRGGMTFWRTASWFAAAIYAMALWTYTLVPFPQPSDVECSPTQLRPFQFVDDILGFDTSSISALMSNPAVLQATLNVVLFAPLGWFIRQLAGRGIVIATVTGFAISAFIEFTQLSGIWGLYECAYRVFDVDDLMMNTLGAFVGSSASLLFFRRGDDAPDASVPRPITAPRRFIGIGCDMAIAWVGSWFVVIGTVFVTTLRGDGEIAEPGDTVMNIAFLLPLFAQLVSVLSGAVTLGERLVLIASAQTRLPAAISKPLRFLFGIGGYMLLTQWPFPGSGLILTVLMLATFIMVFTTRSHRGLACAVAGIELVDSRADRGDARGERRAERAPHRGRGTPAG